MSSKLKMAMLSTGVRRDTTDPVKYFKKIEAIHFYTGTPYSDLYPEELAGLVKYRSFFDLCKKMRKYKFDVIQGNEPYAFPMSLQPCAASYTMSRLSGAPLFFPMLENTPPEMKFGVMAPLMKNYLRSYAKHAFAVLYLNNGAMKNLLDAGVEKKKLVRRNWGTWGVDTEDFNPKKSGAEPGHDRMILFVGWLSETKGVPYLLPAFKKVKKVVKDAKLVLAGEGPLRREVEHFSKANGMEESIILLGAVKNRELPPYFRAAEITVTPSVTTKKWREQIGMVNLQSMACGTPVVSTFSGAIPEYVRHNETGILVPERDPDSLAAAMAKLLKDDGLRKRLGENSRKHVVDNFDAKKNVIANEKLLLELLERD